MQTITRATLNKSKTRRHAHYPIGDGLQVRLQSLTESEKAHFDAYVADDEGKYSRARAAERRRLLIQMTMIGDDGKRIYDESELGEMLNCDAKLTDAIYEHAVAHTGIFGDVEKKGNDQPGSAKTGDSGLLSDSALNSASTTPSPGLTQSPPTSSIDGSTITNANHGATTGDAPAQ